MPTTLTPGDIALVEYNADTPDSFAFVVLVDIGANTIINFTDNGWSSTTNAFRSAEGTITWTSPSSTISAGTVVRITNPETSPSSSSGTVALTGLFNLSASGDQILAYQGTSSSPTFIAAINNEGSGVWQANATDSNTSALPPNLIDGAYAVALNEIDNTKYNSTLLSGTRANLLTAINNNSNWSGSDTAAQTFTDNFSLSGGADTTGPTASLANIATITTSGSGTLDLTITYTDATAVKHSTLDSNDIQVTGPNSFNQLATFINSSPASDNTSIISTYRINVPGGSWDTSENGTYTVTLQPNQVSDTVSTPNFATSGSLGTFSVSLDLRIRDIQGSSHFSSLNNQTVANIQGVVTVVRSNGFYIQDPNGDNNDSTSEGIFVFTSSTPTVTIGQSVAVAGTVQEFRPGGEVDNLTITQINTTIGGSVANIASLGTITPTIIGNGGRTIPTAFIQNDFISPGQGNVETGGDFDPTTEGIDFYESLEGMLVQINNGLSVSPTNNFGEVWVVADNGTNATGLSSRGTITINPNDFNPERIQIDGIVNSHVPNNVNVGTVFNTITGVVDYGFNNYEVLTNTPLSATASTLTKEVTNLVGNNNNLSVATFNVENLDPNDPATKFNNLANRIVTNLKSPDIITLEEIQDNNGSTNDSVVDASTTYQTLITAITNAGGPTYQYRQIDPLDDTTGGEPGGNIRVGFLFNPNRVSFVDRAGGNATSNTTVNNVNNQPQLSASPGLIDPTNSAFNSSRRPLVGEFQFQGETVFVIGNHWNSKGGDDPLYGPTQNPLLSSEVQRNQQAQVVNNFVDSLLAVNANANILVVGDLNDFQWSEPVNIVRGIPGGSGKPILTSLVTTLPTNEQYTYNFQGNAQVLDHILASDSMMNRLVGYDSVHINSEFFDQDSDHDPSVAVFNFTTHQAAPNGTLVNGTLGIDEYLVGTSGRDRINARDGNDTIIGKGDSDNIWGGTGTDTFMYESVTDSSLSSGIDRIVDFRQSEGDRFKFPNLPNNLYKMGNVSAASLEIAANTAFVGNSLSTDDAVFFIHNQRTYLGVNNNQVGFQSASDYLIDVSAISYNSADINTIGALTVANYFTI